MAKGRYWISQNPAVNFMDNSQVFIGFIIIYSSGLERNCFGEREPMRGSPERSDMLDKFREIYDRELEVYESEFERLVLSSSFTRMFVYEVCKHCIIAEQPTAETPDAP